MTSQRPRRIWTRLLVLGAALVAADALLHLGAAVSPFVAHRLARPWDRATVPDEVLGYRFSPYVAGHDATGHRNERVPASCDVLALGDSWTYGYGVRACQAWPAQLAGCHGIEVYNAGIGGYSALHADATFAEFEALPQRAVVFALFLGNDLSDAFTYVYEEGLFPAFRTEAEAETARTMHTLRETAFELDGDDLRPRGHPPLKWHEYSAILRLLRGVWYDVGHAGGAIQGPWASPYEGAVENPHRFGFDAAPRLRTVFPTPLASRLAVDLGDARIRAGLRLTLEAVRSMAERARRLEVEFAVALLPTKFSVYAAWLPTSGVAVPAELDGILRAHRAAELDAKAQLVAGFERLGVGVVDTEAEFVRRLEVGTPAFFENDDAHPTAAGHFAIAESLAAFVSRAMQQTAGR